jgi:hypothetical protein
VVEDRRRTFLSRLVDRDGHLLDFAQVTAAHLDLVNR